MPDPVSPRARRIWRLTRRFPGAPSDALSTVRRPMTGIVVILRCRRRRRGGAVWLARVLRAELARDRVESAEQLAGRNAEIDRRLVGMTETMDRRFGELDTKVDRRLGEMDVKVDRRLAGMTETSTRIHERLGKVDEATAQMNERAKDFQRFEQLLRPPKARGGVGELLLKQLLADVLPAEKFSLQYGFSSGERVDAVIRLDGVLIPIDAKFPLDNFQRVIDADDDAGPRGPCQGVRAGREGPHRRDRREVHPARRGHVRVRVHVPARRGRLLRARLQPDRRRRQPGRPRAEAEGVPGLAEHLLHVPAHPRPGLQGPADRGARARGHGLRRRPQPRLRPLQGGLRRGRQAPGQRADEVRGVGAAPSRFEAKLERASESELPRARRSSSPSFRARSTPRSQASTARFRSYTRGKGRFRGIQLVLPVARGRAARPRRAPAPGLVAGAALRGRGADASPPGSCSSPPRCSSSSSSPWRSRTGGRSTRRRSSSSRSSRPRWPPLSGSPSPRARGRESLRRGASRPQRIRELEVLGAIARLSSQPGPWSRSAATSSPRQRRPSAPTRQSCSSTTRSTGA